MKHYWMPLTLAALLTACAATPPAEGPQATQAMTDMDGKPVDPGRSGTLGSGARIGIGVGSWGGHSGGGVGIGLGF